MRNRKTRMRRRMEKRKEKARKNRGLQFNAKKGRNHQGYL